MPQNYKGGFRNYNTLGSAEPESLSVQSDSQSFHEIKSYNEARDVCWEMIHAIVLAQTKDEVLQLTQHLKIAYLKADSVWHGIRQSAMFKAQGLQLEGTRFFKYEGEMEKKSVLVQRYIDFYLSPEKFQDQNGDMDPEWQAFKTNTQKGQMDWFKNKIQEVVSDADKTWGDLAAKIGFSMPLKIAEEQEAYFRG